MFVLLIYFETAVAGSETCDDTGLRIAYQALEIEGSLLCFLYTPNKVEGVRHDLSLDPDGISLYSIDASGQAGLVYQLAYAGTKGKIKGAFFSLVGNSKLIFVIHSMEAPSSWDVVGDVYSVSVIGFDGEKLVVDLSLSRFFDLGGDSVNAQGEITHIYPYKDQVSVERAIRSPIFNSVKTSTPINAIVREKTALYGGDLEPATWQISHKYAFKNDRVTLEDSTAGWCKISYVASIEPSKMWLSCDAIYFLGNQ